MSARSLKQLQFLYVSCEIPRLWARELSALKFVVPSTIAKALELFMQSLIDQACVETRSRNAKRLSVAHLYGIIESRGIMQTLTN